MVFRFGSTVVLLLFNSCNNNVRQICVLEITNLVVSGAFEIFVHFWDGVPCLQCSTVKETVFISFYLYSLDGGVSVSPSLGAGGRADAESAGTASARSFAVGGKRYLGQFREGHREVFFPNPLQWISLIQQPYSIFSVLILLLLLTMHFEHHWIQLFFSCSWSLPGLKSACSSFVSGVIFMVGHEKTLNMVELLEEHACPFLPFILEQQ